MEPTNSDGIPSPSGDLFLKSDLDSKRNKQACKKHTGKLIKDQNKGIANESQIFDRDPLNGFTQIRNELDEPGQENNNYFNDAKITLAPITNLELNQAKTKQINKSMQISEESVGAGSYACFVDDVNKKAITCPKTLLPRWVSEEELYAFEKESTCSFLENKNDTVISPKFLSSETQMSSIESLKIASFIKQGKPEYIYSMNGGHQNPENGVDELMKIFPLNCYNKLVRAYSI